MDNQNENRNNVVQIDVSSVTDTRQLHDLLKRGLLFPDFYGMNWDAFWDAITGLVEMPRKLVFTGWGCLKANLPRDAEILMESLDDLNREYPSYACEVEYLDKLQI